MTTSEEATQNSVETLRQQTEAEYDATVRADIELFRSYAEKWVAGEITDDQFRAQRLRRSAPSGGSPGDDSGHSSRAADVQRAAP